MTAPGWEPVHEMGFLAWLVGALFYGVPLALLIVWLIEALA